MRPCYPDMPNTKYRTNVPGCDGTLVPEDPARLEGPELGFAIYHDKYAEQRGEEADYVVRVIERSYVWSPELHGDPARLTGAHGHRHYDWSVIERGPGKYRAVVVNDTDLSPLPEKAHVTYAMRVGAY